MLIFSFFDSQNFFKLNVPIAIYRIISSPEYKFLLQAFDPKPKNNKVFKYIFIILYKIIYVSFVW